jgi:hypothetical protein
MSEAAAHLRRNREGVLLADSLAHPVRFVIDGGSGRLVFPADGTILSAEELVLFVPRESPQDDHELQLLLSTGPATDAAADRWRAYHGQPEFNALASFGIEDAKFDGQVVEEAITAPNPLLPAEGKLCKALNAHRARLAAACLRRTGVDLKDPLAVGVDPFGIDIRARFGIVRIDFDEPVGDPPGALAAIEGLLGSVS